MRVGEEHHRAKLTDRDVELIRQLLTERRGLIATRQASGDPSGKVDQALHSTGLSYAAIARKMDISKSMVRDIGAGTRRRYS